MTTASLALVVVMGVMFATGIYIMLERSLTRILIGFLLVGNAINVLIILMSGGTGKAPIMIDGVTPEEVADPLPQAMILTAIVINFGIAAFLLALVYRTWWLAQLDNESEALSDEEEDEISEDEFDDIVEQSYSDDEAVATLVDDVDDGGSA